MCSRSLVLRLLIGLVVLTSTPGLAELTEYTLHAAVGVERAHQHELDEANAPCDAGCPTGMFHTCRCGAVQLATASGSTRLERPPVIRSATWYAPISGRVEPAHAEPPFRPPTA